MSVEEYLRSFASEAPALRKVQRIAKAKGTNRLSLSVVNAEIKRYRRPRRTGNA
jgi:hypothetical protein